MRLGDTDNDSLEKVTSDVCEVILDAAKASGKNAYLGVNLQMNPFIALRDKACRLQKTESGLASCS